MWCRFCVIFASTNLPHIPSRTTMADWTAVTTRPIVRTASSSAGTSLTTTRCPRSPPPPSSRRQPTSCFTPACDRAARRGDERETHSTPSRTSGSRWRVLPFNPFLLLKVKVGGPGSHTGRRVCVRWRRRRWGRGLRGCAGPLCVAAASWEAFYVLEKMLFNLTNDVTN